MRKALSDSAIHQAIVSELEWSAGAGSTSVRVLVRDGAVTLSGAVERYSARVAAERAARGIPGVRGVANELEVCPPHRTGPSDTDLADAVRAALERDERVPDERITTVVANGHVTLEGLLDCCCERAAAERAVRPVVGMRGLTNALAVITRLAG